MTGKVQKDERDIIAGEFHKLIHRVMKQGVEDEYILYLLFCMTGGFILKIDPHRFQDYVKEILQVYDPAIEDVKIDIKLREDKPSH